jgi:hypothetical protein
MLRIVVDGDGKSSASTTTAGIELSEIAPLLDDDDDDALADDALPADDDADKQRGDDKANRSQDTSDDGDGSVSRDRFESGLVLPTGINLMES